MNYYDQKIRQTRVRDIWNHYTAVSALLSLISSIYRDLYPAGVRTSEPRSETNSTVHITHKGNQINYASQLLG